MQHPDLVLQHPDKTLATYVKHLKHLKHAFETCMLCNIQIYFCNIMMKHLKHTFETTETHENICLQHMYIVTATYATSQIDFCNI
jgi:hypothetical protein